tara:strand:+ start:3577 stop:4050 length:474 start_codon:yes stop_codon:yes gene_type:complete
MAYNWVIYNRNNGMLGLGNHIDGDGDLDPQYALLRNVGLTGRLINGKFISDNKKHYNWLIGCATTNGRGHYSKYDNRPCPVCSGIFEDAKNGNYNITPFYMKNVVKLIKEDNKTLINQDQEFSKWDKLAKSVVKDRKADQDVHPLFDEIIKRFCGED